MDDLVRDMGLRTFRTRNVLAEYFLPFWPQYYQGLTEERRILRDFDALLAVTRDAKFVTARHSLQAPRKIGAVSPDSSGCSSSG